MAAVVEESIETEEESGYHDETKPLLASSKAKSSCEDGLIPCRYVLCLTGFVGILLVYALRSNLSVALVAMVNHTAIEPPQRNVSVVECPQDVLNGTVVDPDGPYKWDEPTQSIILGSFFWGYAITQIPGGIISNRYGGKWCFGLGVAGTGALTLLTPVVAEWGKWWLVALRVAEGIGEGLTYPAMYCMVAKWAPPLERTIMISLTFCGSSVGTIISMPVSGLLCRYGPVGGWPSVFYIFGSVAVVWFFFYVFLVYEDPASHPRISRHEKLYIQRALGNTVVKSKSDHRVPWLSIVTSVPIWAVNLGFFGYTWCVYTLLTCMPQYLNEILQYNLQQNGFISALPYIASFLVALVIGFPVDKLRARGLRTVYIRKLVNTIGLAMDGVLLLGAGYVGCDRVAAVALLTASSGFGSFNLAGMAVNHIELSPRYAAVTMSFTNTCSQIPGILAPMAVGYFTNANPTRESWMKVFYLGAGMSWFSALCFLLFGSCDRQKWNEPDWLTTADQSADSSRMPPSDSLIGADGLRTILNEGESTDA